MLAVIWWMYDGYAWLTNAIATDLLRFRLLLLGGMGGFLVIALAVPDAYGGNGLAFGIGYALVVVLHAGMYAKGTSVSEVAAILRIVPFNITAAVLVLVGGAAGGRPQDILWAAAALLLWFTPWFTSTEGFVIEPAHFVERHGLVIIVALGESIVVVGAGAAGVPLDAARHRRLALACAERGALVALLSRRGRCGAGDEGRVAAASRTCRAHRLRLLALRPRTRRRRRRGRAEEGGRRPVRPIGRLDRRRSSRSAWRCSRRARSASGRPSGSVSVAHGSSQLLLHSRRFPWARSGRRPASSLRSPSSSSRRSPSRDRGAMARGGRPEVASGRAGVGSPA